jgi:hypothetical protein
MANINTFAVSPLKSSDKLLASDGVTGQTKNVSPEDVADLNGGAKIYRAFLTQSGTGAPLATVVGPNTLGNVVWTRTAAGVYEATLSNAFIGYVAVVTGIAQTDQNAFSVNVTSGDTFELGTYFSGVANDDLLIAQYIEIRTY